MKKIVLVALTLITTVLVSCSSDTKVETSAVDSTVVKPVDTTVCPLIDSVSIDTTKKVK